jgi:hypothetical protein
MALKPALDSALRARKMMIADLARRPGTDDRKATRLIDPRAARPAWRRQSVAKLLVRRLALITSKALAKSPHSVAERGGIELHRRSSSTKASQVVRCISV